MNPKQRYAQNWPRHDLGGVVLRKVPVAEILFRPEGFKAPTCRFQRYFEGEAAANEELLGRFSNRHMLGTYSCGEATSVYF